MTARNESEVRVMDLAPQSFFRRVEASAKRRWPDHTIARIRRAAVGRRSSRTFWIESYGVFVNGELVAYARVNRAGAVYWHEPLRLELWEQVSE